MIRIHALGGLSVRGDTGQPLTGSAAQPRRMAVLALLALGGDRGVAREKILALLWPDADDERGPRILAQALYALRQDLGSDEAILGGKELRLDPSLVSSDVAEFAAAVSAGDDERAATLYTGPFLDGFHAPGVGEFERWSDTERRALAHDYERVVEGLARAAAARGEFIVAVAWWRKLAALDPLNARVALGLMRSLAASGDPAGALRHGRVYEVLLEEELDLPPDHEVVQYADQLRREAAAPPPPVASPAAVPPSPPPEPPHPAAPPLAASPTHRWQRRRPTAAAIVAMAAGAIIGGAVVAVWIGNRISRSVHSPAHVVAVGRIATYPAGAADQSLGAPLSDLLATNLARIPGLRVVSPARMLELVGQRSATTDTSPGALIAAARLAAATDIIDGTLVRRDSGRLRLDLRRVDLSTGAIVDARSVEGPDLFALVDSGTARLAASLGARAPEGSAAAVTTHSDAAYRLYVEGVRRYYELDRAGAEALFAAALDADSAFAMAAYYWARCAPDSRVAGERIARAVRMSATASDRERLFIRADAALRFSSPELAAITDTLAARYPDEVAPHTYRGAALVLAEDFLNAVPHLQRAIAMDSLAVRSDGAARAECGACDAFSHLVFAYLAADSVEAAERESRRWTRLLPHSPTAWLMLAGVLSVRGRVEEGTAAVRTAIREGGSASDAVPAGFALQWLRAGDYTRADELLRALLLPGKRSAEAEGRWFLAISEREQGRLARALDEAVAYRALNVDPIGGPNAAPIPTFLDGLMLDESGRHREAVVVFDSISRFRVAGFSPSAYARNHAWALTQSATALAAAGDTGRLGALADTVRVYGARSAYGRDQRLYHYVTGLLLAARGQDDAAITEFQASIRSRTLGYTRANYELARALLRRHRASEAVAVLQPALRGFLEGSNLYVSRTAVHNLLAAAWAAAGRPDSAAAHYAIVARTWANGDLAYRVRADSARARATALRLPR